jgi:uncharacterized protein
MSQSTLLAPVDRQQKLVTHVDRATRRGGLGDRLADVFGAAFGNAVFDRETNAPMIVGPGEWQPGLRYDVRQDSWVNEVTGFGTLQDKTMSTSFRPSNWLSDGSLEALFHGDDITKRAIVTPAKEMMRKGFGLDFDGKRDKDTESAILDQWEELNASEVFARAQYWGGLFGDGAVILGADDGRPTMLPLVPEAVRKIEWIEDYDRRYYSINSYYQTGPKFGKPETYALGNPGALAARIQIVHESRMIRFGGAITTTHMRQVRGGYDASKIQEMYEVLRAFATGYKAVEVLLTDGPQGVYKIKNLQTLLAGKNKSLFEQRLQMVDMFRSAMRAVVIDTDSEDFERAPLALTGVADVLNELKIRVAASVHMPVTKLFGTSATGLTATGEGDTRNWYDELETDQKNYLAPKVRQFVKLMCCAKEGPTGGKPLGKVSVVFGPLWTLPPLEESERRLNIAQTDKIYVVDLEAATSEEVALSRFTERGYNGDSITIDRELRQELLDRDREEQLQDTEAIPPANMLTPVQAAAAITVDEARAAMGLGPDPDPEVGAMKLAEVLAKQQAATAPGSHPTDPKQNEPNGFPVQEPPDPNDPPPNSDKPGAQGPAGPPAKKTTAK